jgi:hypothetical protein
MEQEFRAALARSASAVLPAPDPLDRLHTRYRRERLRRLTVVGAGLAAVVVLIVVAVPFHWYPGRGAMPAEGNAIDSKWTRRLIESPPRGNLAQDSAYLAAVTRGFDEQRAMRGADSRLDRMRILFVGDVPGGRLVVAAFYNDDEAMLVYGRSFGSSPPGELVRSGGGVGMSIHPLVVISDNVSSTRDGSSMRYTVGIAPVGCSILVSASGAVAPGGGMVRSWELAGVDGVVVRESPDPEERWRVTCDDTVRYEGPVLGIRELGAQPLPSVHESSLRGMRGDDVTTATNTVEALNRLVASNGMAPGGTPKALWSGRVPGSAASDANAAVAVLDADGDGANGVSVVFTQGTNADVLVAGAGRRLRLLPAEDPTMEESRRDWSLASTAVAANADLVAVRLPERLGSRAVWSDRLLVVAPADAVRVRAGGTTVALVNGVGVLTLPWPVRAPVRLVAVDRSGAEVATARIVESSGWTVFGEPVIENWS